MIYIDLFGPTRITSLGEKKYRLMIIDDFSCFTWILFFAQKDKIFSTFSKFYQKVSNEKNLTIICICSDHGLEFKNQNFKNFYNKHGIEHNFLVPKTL